MFVLIKLNKYIIKPINRLKNRHIISVRCSINDILYGFGLVYKYKLSWEMKYVCCISIEIKSMNYNKYVDSWNNHCIKVYKNDHLILTLESSVSQNDLYYAEYKLHNKTKIKKVNTKSVVGNKSLRDILNEIDSKFI